MTSKYSSPPQLVDGQLLKVCGFCHKALDVEEFAKPENVYCNRCFTQFSTHTIAASRRNALRKYMDRLVAEVKEDKIEAPHITESVSSLMKRFDGGMEGWITQYYEDIQAMRAKSPGSPHLLRAHENISKLVKWSTENRDSAPDVHGMTDDQIKAELVSIVMSELIKGGEDAQSEFLATLDGLVIEDAGETQEGE